MNDQDWLPRSTGDVPNIKAKPSSQPGEQMVFRGEMRAPTALGFYLACLFREKFDVVVMSTGVLTTCNAFIQDELKNLHAQKFLYRDPLDPQEWVFKNPRPDFVEKLPNPR